MAEGNASKARFDAIREANSRTPRKCDLPRDEKGQPIKVTDYYGENTFNLDKMKSALPKAVFDSLLQTIESGKTLEKETAKVVAEAVLKWAMERGATHFCHWFQPQTGLTAEKHDSFLTLDGKKAIEKFSAGQLIQSEPDASSFPSGGMRTTFEARGYTAWDPTSPIFLVEGTNGNTLCIPSVFISYTGDALDKKTALLRSQEALSVAACELLDMIGEKGSKRVVSTLGCEQEYFLIDRSFYTLRPDLVMCGRTLMGGQPPKGQQLEDHYFGSIPARIAAFMSEVEYELYRLGVPTKTRHNEVAPSQYETAPIFEEANVAIDHNQLTMEILKKVARRHGLECLLHEKPFAGINGSGKHSNWSMAVAASGPDKDGINLLEPGKNPHQNVRFLLFLAATLKGVYRHAGLLRAGIASSGNDHRLGANEAPPAIISVFLGDTLSQILNKIEEGGEYTSNADSVIKLGVSKLPEVAKDNTDRNRTSPFAFTGNKFEFRAVGSSASPALPITFLNAAVAEAIHDIIGSLKAKISSKKNLEVAALEVVQEVVKETKKIRFEGNNYSNEWVDEAAKRGLPNLRKTPEALEQLKNSTSKKLLTSLKILSEQEIESRFVVRLERYIKNLLIEIDTMKQLVDTSILPACFAYYGDLVQGVSAAKSVGIVAPQSETLNRLSKLISSLQSKRATLESISQKVDGTHDELAKAKILSSEMSQTLDEIRGTCDELEGLVADGYWPLPKYREILFLSN